MREEFVNNFVTFLSKGELGIPENKVTRISFYRHGDFLDSGKLSPKGFQEAVNLGLEMSFCPPDLINASTYERTLSSARGVLIGINSSEHCTKPCRIYEVPLLAPPCSGRQEVTSEDLYHWTSGLAYLIDCYSKQTERIKNTNYRWIVNFTHSMVMGNLLDRLIGWQIRPLNLQDCFNRIDYLKGFDFLTTVDKKGDKGYKVLCGNVLFDPDMEELGQLVNRYKMLPYRGIGHEG